jgi:hypothetical protein
MPNGEVPASNKVLDMPACHIDKVEDGMLTQIGVLKGLASKKLTQFTLSFRHGSQVAVMEQIADWLERLGMSEYAEHFKQNGITIAALRHLTDQDLKEIGVLLGHRRVMLAAINTMGDAARVVAEPAFVPERRPQDTAERRHVTVMFSDLVGSTALSTRLDPEDVRELILAYQQCVTEAVGRHGGFLAKYMGSSILGTHRHMKTTSNAPYAPVWS